MKRLTPRQKYVLASTYVLDALREKRMTPDEYRFLKALACGHFWNDRDFCQFVAFNKKGKRRYFDYCHPAGWGSQECGCEWDFENARRLARAWARK